MPPEENNTENAVTDFLNSVNESPEEKVDIFKEEEAPEPTVEETEEKVLPFHKDPKVQKYVTKQIEKALKEQKPERVESPSANVDYNLPESFVKLIGNDTEEKRQVLKDMSAYLDKIPEKAKEQWLEEQRLEAQRQAEEDEQAEEELDTYFNEIEENYDVDLSSNSASAKKMRTDFIDYVRKIAPKDSQGEITAFPDLVAAFETFQEIAKKPTNSRAKDLASRGMTRSVDTSTSAPSGRSWKDVDRYFDQIKRQI